MNDNKDGTFLIEWEAPQKASAGISFLVNGDPIPGCPFYVKRAGRSRGRGGGGSPASPPGEKRRPTLLQLAVSVGSKLPDVVKRKKTTANEFNFKTRRRFSLGLSGLTVPQAHQLER